jgi:2-polyprenyl-3-methyl-5-hydroxy-6-metoxy-1,4-benzoquinol methylase
MFHQLKKLKRIKEETVRAVLPHSDHVQEPYQATVCAFPFSYSVGRTIVGFCRTSGIKPENSHVLIVGAAGGRDFNWLKGFGYAVDLLDLGHHDWGLSTYIGDVCRAETWEQIETKYDLIVMCDVLEHLPEDFLALKHARTVLKDEGCLFLSVPYKHDLEVTHVRSYSEATLVRLLTLAGYKIIWKRHRPGIFEAFPRLLNALNYGSAVLMPTAHVGSKLLQSLLAIEYLINEKTSRLYRIFVRSPQKGLSLAAKPEMGLKQNYVAINREMFISREHWSSTSQSEAAGETLSN